MIEGFTTKEIAAALNVTERAIQLQSRAWSGGVKRPKGKGLMYPMGSLPEKIRQKMASIYKEQDDAQPDRADGLRLDDAAGDNSPSNADVMLCSDDLGLIGAPSQPEQQPALAVAKPQREPRANGKPKGGKGEAKMDAWLAIIEEWERYKKLPTELSVVQREYAFEAAYNQQEIDVPPEVYETVSKISRATLCRQRIILAKDGITALAGKEGAGRPK
jgi:hypothetical protein